MNYKIKIQNGETRSIEQLIEHYILEKELAKKLSESSKKDRKNLYTSLYDQLYTQITHHLRWTRKSSTAITASIVTQRMQRTIFLVSMIEKVLDRFQYRFRRKVSNTPLLFRGMTIIGIK